MLNNKNEYCLHLQIEENKILKFLSNEGFADGFINEIKQSGKLEEVYTKLINFKKS